MRFLRVVNKRLRRGWTLVLVGKMSGHQTSLDSIYKFSSQRRAMEQASRMNAHEAINTEITEYRVARRQVR